MVNWSALVVAIGLVMSASIFEIVITPPSFNKWYGSLKKPRWHLPLPIFVFVGILVYLMEGIVAYRLGAFVWYPPFRMMGLVGLMIVMLLNALWNYAFFQSRNTQVGFFGVVAYLGPLILLQLILFFADRFSAMLFAAYSLFVVFYDLPLFFQIWRLNTTCEPANQGSRDR